jgi:hypothetical protein
VLRTAEKEKLKLENKRKEFESRLRFTGTTGRKKSHSRDITTSWAMA